MTFNDGMKSSDKDDWTTPKEFFDKLNKEFKFDLDVASDDRNALCKNHYTKNDDGLSKQWVGNVWCNPPYGSEIKKWVEKASKSTNANVVVMLIPAMTDTRYWHDWIFPYASDIRFIKGRLKFSGSKNSAPFPSAVIIFDNRNKDKEE